MSIHHFHAVAGALPKAIGALAFGFLISSPVNAGAVFTWDVNQIGLSGAAFTADALKATEVSHIIFTDNAGNWTEDGYANITGVLNNGAFSVPTGLGTGYTLYLQFHSEGNIGGQLITTATLAFYAVNGASGFSLDGNYDAQVDNHGNATKLLATSSLLSGSTSPPVGSELFAKVLATFNPTADGNAVFLQPQPFPSLISGDFHHPFSDGPNAISFVTDPLGRPGFAINGGNDTLSFIPEPLSLLLFASGLSILLGFSRRSVNA